MSLNYMANQQLADAAGRGISNTASSSFLENNGNYVGLSLSMIYIGIGIAFLYYKYVASKPDDPWRKQKYDLLVPGLLFLLSGIDILYYMNKKNDPDTKNTNSMVGNISLIPFYLAIVAFVGFVVLNIR